MHADMGGFGRRIGKRDRPVEGNTCLFLAVKLHQQSTLDAEKVEIAGETIFQRLDQHKCFLGAAHFRHRDGTVECNDRRGCDLFKRSVKQVYAGPIRIFRPPGRVHAGRQSPPGSGRDQAAGGAWPCR
jgi:hypothetical protein